MDVWTKEEYLRFSDAIADKPYSHLAFEILFWCGLRVGEMLALTPADIDFEASQIKVSKSVARIGGEDILTPPRRLLSRTGRSPCLLFSPRSSTST